MADAAVPVAEAGAVVSTAQTRPNTAVHESFRRSRPDGTAAERLSAVVTYCNTLPLTDGQRADIRRLAHGDQQD